MKRFVVTLSTVFALLTAAAPQAGATDARVQGLLYNLAFEDDVDVFLFPNRLPEYRGVYFHLPPDIKDVFGGVVLGSKESAFAAFIHRPWLSPFDQYRILVTDSIGQTQPLGLLMGSPKDATEVHLPGQVFDLLYGANSWGLGFRFHGWSEVSVREGLLEQSNPGNDMIAMDLNAAFRILPGLDLRADAGITWIKKNGFMLRLLVGSRYIDPDKEKTLRYVIAGELQFSIWSPENGDSAWGITLPVKGGYRMTLIRDVLFLGLLAGVDFQIVDLGAADTKVGLAVPTLEFAVEWEALEWLHLRSAIKGGYGFQFAGNANDDKPKFEQMVFSTGLGFLLGPFTMDATIQYALWHSGPDFISGAAPGLFGSVSLAYTY